MDFLQSIKNDPGALIVGGVWALFAIVWQLRRSSRESKQQDKVANSTSILVDGLHSMADRLQAQVGLAEARAARLTTESADLYIQVGSLTAERNKLQESLAQANATIATQIEQIERLVVDVHNQRCSLDSLAKLNRQMLDTIMEREQAESLGVGREIINEPIQKPSVAPAGILGPGSMGHGSAGPIAICGAGSGS